MPAPRLDMYVAVRRLSTDKLTLNFIAGDTLGQPVTITSRPGIPGTEPRRRLFNALWRELVHHGLIDCRRRTTGLLLPCAIQAVDEHSFKLRVTSQGRILVTETIDDSPNGIYQTGRLGLGLGLEPY